MGFSDAQTHVHTQSLFLSLNLCYFLYVILSYLYVYALSPESYDCLVAYFRYVINISISILARVIDIIMDIGINVIIRIRS